MKTNQVMVRRLDTMEIFQRTSDGFFNATAAVKAFNDMVDGLKESFNLFDDAQEEEALDKSQFQNTPEKGIMKRRELDKYFEFSQADDDKSQIHHRGNSPHDEIDKSQFHHTPEKGMMKRRDLKEYLSNQSTNDFLEAVRLEEGITDVVKASRANKGANAGTWVHPLVFVDLCMWLNPSFKVKVLKFVRDELLFVRDEVGEANKAFKETLTRNGIEASEPLAWMKFASAFKKWAFGSGNAEINRQDLRAIRLATTKYGILCELVENGMFKTFDDIIHYIAEKNRRLVALR